VVVTVTVVEVVKWAGSAVAAVAATYNSQQV
jgi:hypothetical protein